MLLTCGLLTIYRCIVSLKPKRCSLFHKHSSVIEQQQKAGQLFANVSWRPLFLRCHFWMCVYPFDSFCCLLSFICHSAARISFSRFFPFERVRACACVCIIFGLQPLYSECVCYFGDHCSFPVVDFVVDCQSLYENYRPTPSPTVYCKICNNSKIQSCEQRVRTRKNSWSSIIICNIYLNYYCYFHFY